jgi:hypothetical protein
MKSSFFAFKSQASVDGSSAWQGWFAAATLAATGIGLLAPAQFAVAQDTPTLIVLRPALAKKVSATPPPLAQADVTAIKVGGKAAPITAWTTLLKTPDYKGPVTLQLVVLLDSMEKIGVASQFDDLKGFFKHLPPNVEVAVGYLLQGHAKIEQTFTTDPALAGAALHAQPDASLPKNDNGSPYACLRDLASHWPNPDPSKLRAVFMITDGIDRYDNSQSGNQNNPDVDAAAQSLVRNGIAAFSMYYVDPVPPQGRNEGGPMEGQTLLDQLGTQTNGQAFYTGQTAPASFDPILQRFYGTLNSEYVATVTANGKGFKPLDVKTSRTDIKVAGPDGVTVGNVMAGKK